MSSSRGVLREEDVAGFDGLFPASTGFELETAAEGDHVLAVRNVVPIQAGACGGLFEGDGVGRATVGHGAQCCSLTPFDLAAILHEPGDDREQLDERTYAPRVRVV